MSFDGASSMKSLAEKLKNCYGQQLSYIHCLAHCTTLIVKDTITSSELLQLEMRTLKKLYTFLGVYPKRVKLFEEMQEVNPFVDENEDISRLYHQKATVVVVVYPTPSEGWGHGGRPWNPRSWATPQGLDQRS